MSLPSRSSLFAERVCGMLATRVAALGRGTRAPVDADATFLVAHYNAPEFLAACLGTVRRFHPGSRIVVSDSTSSRQAYLDARSECRRHGAELHTLAGAYSHPWLIEYLLRQARTPLAVFLDQDCLLLGPLGPLFDRMGSSVLLAGPRDEMFLTHRNVISLRPDLWRGRLRYYPRYVHASLMATRPAEILKQFGKRPFTWTSALGQNPLESYYGLSERLQLTQPEALCLLESVHTGYGLGMLYLLDGKPLAYHNWYSGRVSQGQATIDGVNADWLRAEARRFLRDWASGTVDFDVAAPSP